MDDEPIGKWRITLYDEYGRVVADWTTRLCTENTAYAEAEKAMDEVYSSAESMHITAV